MLIGAQNQPVSYTVTRLRAASSGQYFRWVTVQQDGHRTTKYL